MAKESDLTRLVIEVDDELIKEGIEPFQRPLAAYIKISQRLQSGCISTSQDNPLFNSINHIYSELYRPSDLHMPPMHVGAFMFRDVFFPLCIPVIYGSPVVNPIDFLTDASEMQKQWLFTDKQSGLAFFDQIIDLMDFVYGLDDIEKTGQLSDKTIEWWYLAKQQLEAASATLLGSFNKYAIVQNCCISVELLLKGALMAKGIDENTLASKKHGYGHNLENLVNKVAGHLPSFDQETVLLVVKQLPDYVKSRYEARDFSRLDLGRFLMNIQFISGEILRQFSERNFRQDFTATLDDTWDLAHRAFPQKLQKNSGQ